MKTVFLIFVILIVSAPSFCQDIYGTVSDEKGMAVPYAKVRIMENDADVLLSLAVTDSAGAFRIEDIRRDSIRIIVSGLGFETNEMKLYNYTCPLKIILHEKAQTLEGVTVTANTTVLDKNKVTFFPTKKEKRMSNGGYNLLYNMPISVLTVDPLSKKISTNMGDGVVTFINGTPATSAEVQNVMAENVKKIEYLEQPSDSRFNNARYAINIVVQQYDKGGYTKVDGQQGFEASSGNYSLYSHYEHGKMIYDLLGGYDYDKQSHLGETANTEYNFPRFVMNKKDEQYGKSRNNQTYATFRAKYMADSIIIANSVGVQLNRTPYRDLSGSTTTVSAANSGIADEIGFDSHSKEHSYSLAWDGNYFFRLKNNFDLTTDFTASYMNTTQDYGYWTGEKGQDICNDIDEDAWNLKLNATLRKKFRTVSLGLNLISSYNGNTIHYRGTTPSDVEVKDWYIMPRLVLNYNAGKFRISGKVGVSYEEATYNHQREVYFFPKSFLSGGYNINRKNSLSFSFEYAMFGNSLGMKSPNLVMNDNYTAIKGNPKLKNFHFISPSLSYNWLASKRASFSFFSRWQYFKDPSVFIWEPMPDENIIVRSYTNDGYLSNLRLGMNGTLRFLDNNLYIKGSVTQNYIKQGGPTEVNTWPVSMSCQVNYFIKNFSVSAFWEKSSKNVSIFETKKWPQNYFLSLSYGYRNFIASFTCKNVFNNSWKMSQNLYHSTPVGYNIQKFGNDYHRSFVLSLSYSLSYGKKTNMKDRVRKSGIPNTAIIE